MIEKRYDVWNYLKAAILFLLFIDHACHAYALHFNVWHFFKDQGLAFFDFVYLHNNNMIIPLLFFVVGLQTPALTQTPLVYMKERLIKLGIPWLLGVFCIVPFLCLPRYLEKYPDLTVHDFLTHYFPHIMQGGGVFWILWYVLALTLMTVALYRFSFVKCLSQKCAEFLFHSPIKSLFGGTLIVVILLVGSDLYWGPYHWVGPVSFMDNSHDVSVFYHLLKLFKVQGSRFLTQGFFFIVGVVIGSSNIEKNLLWKRLASSWKIWLGLYGVSFVLYALYVDQGITYSFSEFYSNHLARLMREGSEGITIQQAFYHHLQTISPRQVLQGLTLVFGVLAWISIFHVVSFPKNLSGFMKNSYGFFLLHEIPVIWLQYILSQQTWPVVLKVIPVTLLGGLITYYGVKGLKYIPGVKRILS